MKNKFAVLYYPWQNYKFDSTFNEEMKTFLKSDCKIVLGESTVGGVYHAKVGFTNVWVRNWPYACFTKDRWDSMTTLRPSRLTMYKLAKRFKEDTGINIYDLDKGAN